MPWQRRFVYKRGSSVLVLCALVVAWEVYVGTILSLLALLAGHEPPLLHRVAGGMLLVLPVAYAATVLAVFVLKGKVR